MKNSLLCLFLLLILFSCQEPLYINPEVEKVAEACGVSHPLQQLSWLKEKLSENDPTSEYCSIYNITQGIYEGKTIFVVGVGGALCCTCAGNSVYNCEGEIEFVCETDKEAAITNKKIIWER